MKVKKLISLLLIISMVFLLGVTFAACEKKDEDGGGEDGGAKAISFLKEAATGERNDYAGSVGYEVKCLADMTVSAVGRPLNGEMNNSHTIYIWEVSSQTLLGSAEVTPESTLDDLGFKTAQLSSPISFKAGESYRIVSSESAEGDKWYDVGVEENDAPELVPTADCEIITPAFTGEDVASYPANEHNPGGKNKGYVGATFYYTLDVAETSDAAE